MTLYEAYCQHEEEDEHGHPSWCQCGLFSQLHEYFSSLSKDPEITAQELYAFACFPGMGIRTVILSAAIKYLFPKTLLGMDRRVNDVLWKAARVTADRYCFEVEMLRWCLFCVVHTIYLFMLWLCTCSFWPEHGVTGLLFSLQSFKLASSRTIH